MFMKALKMSASGHFACQLNILAQAHIFSVEWGTHVSPYVLKSWTNTFGNRQVRLA